MTRTLWLGSVLLAALVGCGDNDISGPGELPANGEQGPPGVSCWDLDESGGCDVATEDTNHDGACTVKDCQNAEGPVGPAGPSGASGPAGAVGPEIGRAHV